MKTIETALNWLNENYPGDIEDFEMSALEYLAENLDIDINTILEGLNEDQKTTMRQLFSMAFLFDWMDEEDRHFEDFLEEFSDLNSTEKDFLKSIRFQTPFSVFKVIDHENVCDLFTDKVESINAEAFGMAPGQHFMTHICNGVVAGPCVPVSDVSWVMVAKDEMNKTVKDNEALEEIGINVDLPMEQKHSHLMKLSASQMIITWLSTQMPSFMMEDLLSFMAPDGENFVVCHRQFHIKSESTKNVMRAIQSHDQIVSDPASDRAFVLLKDINDENNKDNLIANITIMDDAVIVMALSENRDETSAKILREILSDDILEEVVEQRSIDETMKMMLETPEKDEPLLKKASIH